MPLRSFLFDPANSCQKGSVQSGVPSKYLLEWLLDLLPACQMSDIGTNSLAGGYVHGQPKSLDWIDPGNLPPNEQIALATSRSTFRLWFGQRSYSENKDLEVTNLYV